MTLRSHGCAALAPAQVPDDASFYRTVLRLNGETHRLEVRERAGRLIATSDSAPDAIAVREAERVLRRMFRLDENLAPFYSKIAGDPGLGWAQVGAGRLMASPIAFEDLVKTICTTNCAWSATMRMTSALVSLGGGAFPSAQRMAQTPEAWFRDVARTGYRGPYLREIARRVASGELDLERLAGAAGLDDRVDDSVIEERLRELPGVGPYACAHMLMLLGRYRQLVLDSWTRPTYLRLAGRTRATDRTIKRAFARYGKYAGLAFWLFLTRDWHQRR